MAGRDFTGETLGGFLDRVAAREPAPGGGAAAAVAVALAAGLAAMAARFSGADLPDAPAVAEQADRLRGAALALAGEDAAAYAAVLDALRLPTTADERAVRLRQVLERATEVPLAIAEAAADTATLAARLATGGNVNLHGDAAVAVLLADAAARGAA